MTNNTRIGPSLRSKNAPPTPTFLVGGAPVSTATSWGVLPGRIGQMTNMQEDGSALPGQIGQMKNTKWGSAPTGSAQSGNFVSRWGVLPGHGGRGRPDGGQYGLRLLRGLRFALAGRLQTREQ